MRTYIYIYICINRFLRFFHVILRILGQCLALSKTASKSLQIEQPGWVGSRPPARDAEDARPTMGTCLAIICSAKWETVSHIISVYNICHIYNLEIIWKKTGSQESGWGKSQLHSRRFIMVHCHCHSP